MTKKQWTQRYFWLKLFTLNIFYLMLFCLYILASVFMFFECMCMFIVFICLFLFCLLVWFFFYKKRKGSLRGSWCWGGGEGSEKSWGRGKHDWTIVYGKSLLNKTDTPTKIPVATLSVMTIVMWGWGSSLSIKKHCSIHGEFTHKRIDH